MGKLTNKETTKQLKDPRRSLHKASPYRLAKKTGNKRDKRKQKNMNIKCNAGLAEDGIQMRVKDAERNAAEDKRRLELVQARNSAEASVHSVKKSLGEHGDKLDAGEKDKIEAAVKDLEEALKGEDKAAIEAKTEALMSASQNLGEKVYAEPHAPAGAAASAL